MQNIDILSKILKDHCEGVAVAGAATSVDEAIPLITEARPDVLFLDIEIPPYKGFDLLEKLPDIHFDLIFITAHKEYALQAIKFAALDYLLKPISIEEVKAALRKVRPRGNRDIHELAYILKGYLLNNERSFSKIVIPANDGYNVIDLEDIIYCEACDNYTRIQLLDGSNQLIARPLKEYDSMLSDKGFFRVHKSFLINLNHIRKIIKGMGTAVVMTDKKNIPVSMRKKEEFFNSLKGIMNI